MAPAYARQNVNPFRNGYDVFIAINPAAVAVHPATRPMDDGSTRWDSLTPNRSRMPHFQGHGKGGATRGGRHNEAIVEFVATTPAQQWTLGTEVASTGCSTRRTNQADRAAPRGFHLITREIVEAIEEMAKLHVGLLHVFIQHTSASLTINENADVTFGEIWKVRSIQSHRRTFHTRIPSKGPTICRLTSRLR